MIAKTMMRRALPAVVSTGALLAVASVSALLAGSDATNSSDANALPPPSNGAISPQDQADALHFVIAADREIYAQVYLALQTGDATSLPASGNGKPGESWPVPCEMFRRAAESIQSKGAEFSYALRSLCPIDPRDGPQTELEQTGLTFIASHPAQNYYGKEMLGGRRYFTAVYPDLPAAAACIECHNRRATSVPHSCKVGDVIGGVVVRVPLEF